VNVSPLRSQWQIAAVGLPRSRAVEHSLKSAGTSLEKVVMVRIYASNAAYYSVINRVYARFFPENECTALA
jgi:enamine deaminase RidA (YjgF/YER057c/UK114 family)